MIGVSTYQSHRAAEVIIGVDTHRDQHVSVAIDGRGVRLGERHVPTTTRGYEELERWSRGLGEIRAFGIEGTGSYGAGIARFMTVSRAETNQAVWRSKSVPLGLRCSAKMSAYDGCRREPLVAARLVESRRQGNRRLSAWWRLACSA